MDSVIFVGGYPTDFEENSLREIFTSHGSILCVDLEGRPGRSPYAQIEYSDPRLVRDKEPKKNNFPIEYSKSSHNRKEQVSSSYCVFISGLHDSASWQDLKAHMQKVGSVKFARINKDGYCVVGSV